MLLVIINVLAVNRAAQGTKLLTPEERARWINSQEGI